VAFVPEKQSIGRWLTLPSSEQTGSKVQVMFCADGKMVTRYVLDPRVVQADLERNRQSREIWRKGTLLGNTQRHLVPIAHIPLEKHFQLKRRFGKDTKALLKFWNDHGHRDWRASEYRF
jgi:hypothetical protein